MFCMLFTTANLQRIFLKTFFQKNHFTVLAYFSFPPPIGFTNKICRGLLRKSFCCRNFVAGVKPRGGGTKVHNHGKWNFPAIVRARVSASSRHATSLLLFDKHKKFVIQKIYWSRIFWNIRIIILNHQNILVVQKFLTCQNILMAFFLWNGCSLFHILGKNEQLFFRSFWRFLCHVASKYVLIGLWG